MRELKVPLQIHFLKVSTRPAASLHGQGLKNRIEKKAQNMADVSIRKRLRVQKMFEQQSLRDRPEAGRGRWIFNRDRSSERAHDFGKQFSERRSNTAVPAS